MKPMNRPYVYDDFVAEALRLSEDQQRHLIQTLAASLSGQQIAGQMITGARVPSPVMESPITSQSPVLSHADTALYLAKVTIAVIVCAGVCLSLIAAFASIIDRLTH